MRVLALSLLFIWPWPHVERGVAEIAPDCNVNVHFRKEFKRPATCSAISRRGRSIVIVATSRHWASFRGTATDVFDWTCK